MWNFSILCHPNGRKYKTQFKKSTKSKKEEEIFQRKKYLDKWFIYLFHIIYNLYKFKIIKY